MSDRWLVQTTEVWRVPDRDEADALETEFRNDPNFELTKFVKQDVAVKAKGEIVETYVKVTSVKVFNNIKEPESGVRPEYR